MIDSSIVFRINGLGSVPTPRNIASFQSAIVPHTGLSVSAGGSDWIDNLNNRRREGQACGGNKRATPVIMPIKITILTIGWLHGGVTAPVIRVVQCVLFFPSLANTPVRSRDLMPHHTSWYTCCCLYKTPIFYHPILYSKILRFPPQLDHSPTVRCFLYVYYGNPRRPRSGRSPRLKEEHPWTPKRSLKY
jgi:hypothetical protein